MYRSFLGVLALNLLLPMTRAGVLTQAQEKPADIVLAKEAVHKAAELLAKAPAAPALFESRLWFAIAELHSKAGDREGAANAMRQARATIDAQPQENIRSGLYRELRQAYGRGGDAKAVIDLAAFDGPDMRNSGGPDMRQDVLKSSAREAVKAGHLQAAEEIADTVTDPDAKMRLKAQLRWDDLVARAKKGNAGEALRAVEELPSAGEKVTKLVGFATGGALPSDYDHAGGYFMEGLAIAQLAGGSLAGAKETALKALALLPDAEPAQRGRVAAVIVWILAGMDDLPSARKALALIPKTDPKGAKGAKVSRLKLLAEGYVAAGEVRAGRDDAALELVNDFERPGQQAYILQMVALAQARVGRKDASKTNFKRAVELVTGDPMAAAEGTNLTTVAAAQALSGDIAAAIKHGEESGSILALPNVVFAQATLGDFAGARKTAALYKNMKYQYGKSCYSIARTQAKAGQAAAVRQWADEEGDPYLQAHILVGLAEGLFHELKK